MRRSSTIIIARIIELLEVLIDLEKQRLEEVDGREEIANGI